MKKLTLIAAIIFMLGFLVSKYGDRWVTQPHRAVDFKWKLPPDKALTLSDSLAMEGIELALRSSSREHEGWQSIPVGRELTASILRRRGSDNEGMVILTNRNLPAQLYARVELDVTNRILNVAISRPK